jgi:glycine betaine catabolism B
MSIETIQQLIETPAWSSKKTAVNCVNIIQETHDVKTFQFEAQDTQKFIFKPGQFVGIQLMIDGERHNRSYTIASSPSRPHLLELTIKKEVAGIVSPWLHQNIKIGSTLELRGPAGRFNNMDIAADKVLLISAGSGITPMMSMARFWSDTNPTKDIKFLNWVRSVQDIIFRRELALMDANSDSFQLEVICTQPGLTENWLGRRGRINATTLQDMAPDLKDRMVFCCGPEGFMQQVKDCLQQLGFDMANYHDESFDPGGKKKAKLVEIAKTQSVVGAIEDNTHVITLTRSNRQIDIRESELLLEKLEAEGALMESACRAGNCGACRVVKLSGATKTKNETGLLESDRVNGGILTCTTQVLSDISIDL